MSLRARSARSLVSPRDELMEQAAERSRVSALVRVGRLRSLGGQIALTAVGAGLAWLVATDVIGHQSPFFAPVAAIIALGTTVGQRGRGLCLAAIEVSSRQAASRPSTVRSEQMEATASTRPAAAELGRAGPSDPQHFNEPEKGGHFAAWEQPELFATEVRAAFSSTTNGG